MISTVKLTEIPDCILPYIKDSVEKHCYLGNSSIEEIFICHGQYRINTSQGQFRYPLDTDITITVY